MKRASRVSAAGLAFCLGALLAQQLDIVATHAGAVLSPAVRISGPTPRDSCPDSNDGDTPPGAYEPFIAAGPANMALLALWTERTGPGDISSNSSDNGSTWSENTLPLTTCLSPGVDRQFTGDPWASIAPDGTVYAIGAEFSGQEGLNTLRTSIRLTTSRDDGKTWKPATVLEAGRKLRARDDEVDKPMVVADPSTPGVAYAVWSSVDLSQHALPHSTRFSRTTDGGATWSSARTILVPPAHTGGAVGDEIVVGPGGHTLYDVFEIQRARSVRRMVCKRMKGHRRCRSVREYPAYPTYDTSLAVMSSTDRGNTWSTPSRVASVHTTAVLGPDGFVLTGDLFAHVAIDRRNGRLYIVVKNRTVEKQDGIYFTTSGDSGSHWSTPVRIGTPASSFLPTIAISDMGVVGVTYYEVGSAASPAEKFPVDFDLITSDDSGAHWAREKNLAHFDLTPIEIRRIYFVGDYEGLVATGESFHPVWVMPNPDPSTRKGDVYTATVPAN